MINCRSRSMLARDYVAKRIVPEGNWVSASSQYCGCGTG